MKNILILQGDGIGQEVTRQAEKVLSFLNKKQQKFAINYGKIGGSAIDEYGNPYPSQTRELAEKANVILLGAVGGPKWDTLETSIRPEKGLLAIRKHLGLFANLRPAIVYDELADASTLKREVVSGLDILIVRELTGDVYFGEPKGIEQTPQGRKGYSNMIYYDYEIQRVARIAFELARKRNKKVCSIDKANVLACSELWREEVIKIQQAEYSDIELTHMYVDNAAMQLVRNPKQFDVIVTGNIFGDILSDEASQLTGSLGMLPSASLGNSDQKICNALYEPIHGSAPDIAGKNVANPIATILSLAMMFKYSFDMKDISDKVEASVKQLLADGFRTADIMQAGCTKIGTEEAGDKIVKNLEKII